MQMCDNAKQTKPNELGQFPGTSLECPCRVATIILSTKVRTNSLNQFVRFRLCNIHPTLR